MVQVEVLVALVPLEVLVGSRGDGVRKEVVIEGSRPVHQLRDTLEVGAWKEGWRVRHLSEVRDGAFSVWLVPPGDDAETVPVILYDVDARAPRCEPTKLVVPDLRACLPESGERQERVLELLKTQL